MPNRPTLLNSCAFAASLAEARFRIDGPAPPARTARVLALDIGALDVVRRLAVRPWRGARFLSCEDGFAVDRELAAIPLRTLDGGEAQLTEALAGADVVMMIATSAVGAAAAAAIGNACTLRGIMTAGLVLAAGPDAEPAVSALRPHARVLLVSRDEDDAAELLAAVGA
jgi:hypothetical protein